MLEGGITNPIDEEEILTAAPDSLEYPSCSILGARMLPIAEAAATAEPAMAPKRMAATTWNVARPLGSEPIRLLAKLISRWALPPRFMICPARIKKGMANRVKLSRLTINC